MTLWPHLLCLFLLFCVAPSAMKPFNGAGDGAGKRCRWESTSTKIGMQLADRSELQIEDLTPILSLQQIATEHFHHNAKGIVFLTLQSLQHVHTITANTCVAIVKGFNGDRVTEMGFSAKRVSQAVLTLKDTQTDIVEPRAVTLVNFADVSDMWVSRAEDVTDVVLTEDVKLTVLFEIRENSSRPPHWQLYSEKKAFATFCEATVQAIEDKEQAIWFPVVAKEGYMFRKAIFPAKWRNLVYAHSGRMSVSVKMLRNGEEKLEKGLDLIRLPRNNGHDMHSIWEAGHGQKGFFRSFLFPNRPFHSH